MNHFDYNSYTISEVLILKRSSLIAGLDCGLDHWTGLTFELKLRVSHDLHPIRCAELGHMFDA